MPRSGPPWGLFFGGVGVVFPARAREILAGHPTTKDQVSVGFVGRARPDKYQGVIQVQG